MLKREEQASTGLKAELTLEEEKRKEVEVKITEEGRRIAEAVEQAVSCFKSSKKLKNFKMAFA